MGCFQRFFWPSWERFRSRSSLQNIIFGNCPLGILRTFWLAINTDRFKAVLLFCFIINVIVCPLFCLSSSFRWRPVIIHWEKELSSWHSAYVILDAVFGVRVSFRRLLAWEGCGIRLHRLMIIAFSSTLHNQLCLLQKSIAFCILILFRIAVSGSSFSCHLTIDNKLATIWQNQQCGYPPSEDSDQPGHPPSLIRVFVVRMKDPSVLHADSEDSDQTFAGRIVTLLVLSWGGSNVEAAKFYFFDISLVNCPEVSHAYNRNGT